MVKKVSKAKTPRPAGQNKARDEYQKYHLELKAKLKELFDDDESLGHVMEAMGEACRDYGEKCRRNLQYMGWWEQMRIMMVACEKMTEHFEEG